MVTFFLLLQADSALIGIAENTQKKKREDPQMINSGNFHRICVICEEKYIQFQINVEYKQKQDKYEN